MALQNAFYLAALIFLLLGILFFLGCIGFLIFLFFSFRNAKAKLSQSVDTVMDEMKTKSATANFGMFLLGSILKKIKKTE